MKNHMESIIFHKAYYNNSMQINDLKLYFIVL